MQNYGICSCISHFFCVSLRTFCAQDMKLSIITINRNNAAGLRKTMESVFAQTYRDFEYIVVDGASTDESVEVIREYDSINHSSVHPLTFTWLSEPDTGIYNAMNKGIRMSKGEYSLLLNSGDCLAENDVVKSILPKLHTDGVIQGGMYLYEKKPECLDYGNGMTEMSFFDVIGGDFLHQADFVKKDVYEQYGYYDESYRIAGDTAFFLKVLGFYDVSFRCEQIPISFFEGGGLASGKDEKMKALQLQEVQRMKNEILGPRLAKVCAEDCRKVRLFDTLHAHKWSRKLLTALFCLTNWIYRKG